jgi:hypothetical protein
VEPVGWRAEEALAAKGRVIARATAPERRRRRQLQHGPPVAPRQWSHCQGGLMSRGVAAGGVVDCAQL